MDFQQKLSFFRKRKNLSQEALAAELNVSRQAVAKWETGVAMPDVSNLIALSELFGVTLDRLLKEEENGCSTALAALEPVGTEALRAFLREAKQNTYAADGAKSAPSRLCSHDLSYEKGAFFYLDTYLGGERFAGEEAVWENGAPVWAMNYVGRVLDERFSGGFLCEALLLVSQELPSRGPALHKNGDFTYTCRTEGDFTWFEGQEEIFLGETKVFECRFHGGSIT